MKREKLSTIWQQPVIILAMLTMPIAAAINFGAATFDMLLHRVNVTVAIIGGIATGVGFECLGIMAGHYAIAYYGKRDNRWIIAAVVMLVYVVVGSLELWEIPLARFVPLLGAMVYILAGLGQELTAVLSKEQNRATFDLNQEAADKELDRRLKIANAKLKHEERMARIEAKASANSAAQNSQSTNPAPQVATLYECSCGRVFDKAQSYSAHTRHCEIRKSVSVSLNGAATK